jgi:hypothetical protein
VSEKDAIADETRRRLAVAFAAEEARGFRLFLQVRLGMLGCVALWLLLENPARMVGFLLLFVVGFALIGLAPVWLRRRVEAAGFDGAVVLRLSGSRTERTYVPSNASLWGYYGRGWGMAYDPGYMREDELVDIETALYSVADRQLLWVGTTQSLNPSDVRRTVDEIARAVAERLRQEGLIAPPAG